MIRLKFTKQQWVSEWVSESFTVKHHQWSNSGPIKMILKSAQSEDPCGTALALAAISFSAITLISILASFLRLGEWSFLLASIYSYLYNCSYLYLQFKLYLTLDNHSWFYKADSEIFLSITSKCLSSGLSLWHLLWNRADKYKDQNWL